MNTEDKKYDTPSAPSGGEVAGSSNAPAAGGGSLGKRLIILLTLFGVVAGGIYGTTTYLKSQVPQGEERFRNKETGPNITKDEEPATGLEIVSSFFAGEKPSKEVEELKKKKEDEVVFTYDQIAKMSKADLEKNIKDVEKRLLDKRGSLPPSFGAGSMGGGNKKEGEENKDTVASLALPLEVMQQMLEKK